jgi:cytochrome P450
VSDVEVTVGKWPFERAEPLDPPPAYAELRATCPVSKVEMWDGSQAWLATRYSDIRALLSDPGLSSDTSNEGFPQSSETIARARGGQKSFARLDPPRHDEHRNMLKKDFLIARVNGLRPYLEELVDGLLDDMEKHGKPIDLVPTFAQAVPAHVICKLLDLPDEHNEFFQDRVNTWMSLDSSPDMAAQAGADAIDYFARLIDEREVEVREGRTDDVVSRLIREHLLTGDMDKLELTHMLHLLLLGGFDTTANMIALGTLTFLEHPDQLADLQADPSLVPRAVEELLRYLTVAHHVAFRLAMRDVEAAGGCIHAGDGVIAPLAAANRDPEVFEDPDVFDIHRDARSHVAFGFGIHQCLGQPLARLELNVVFERFFQRFPTLHLAVPREDLRFRNSMIYGVESLPVAW